MMQQKDRFSIYVYVKGRCNGSFMITLGIVQYNQSNTNNRTLETTVVPCSNPRVCSTYEYGVDLPGTIRIFKFACQ